MRFSLLKENRFILALLIFCCMGIALRFFQYATFPVSGETQDEVAWTFLGSSLLQKQEPTSWSYFAAYPQKEQVTVRNESFWLVTPALDHPPLFSLIPGLVSTLQGTAWNDLPSVRAIRFPIVVISSLNLLLLSAWLYRSFGKSVATLVGTLVFATAPSLIFLSRLVVSENLLLTWILLLLLASTFSHVPRWILFLLHAVLPLTKISGLAIGVGSIFSLYQRKKDWQSALLGLGFGFLSLCLYAWFFDWQIFLTVQLQQSQRDSGLLSFFLTQLWSNVLIAKPFADTWITFGWWTAFGALLMRKAPKGWLTPETWLTWQYLFLAQLAFLVLSVGEHTVHGWYKIVFFPFFALGISLAVQWLFTQKHWLGLASTVVLLSATVRTGLYYVFVTNLFPFQSSLNKLWQLLAGAIVLPSAMKLSDKNEMRVWQGCWILILTIVVLCNCLVVLNIRDQTYWQDELYITEGIRP